MTVKPAAGHIKPITHYLLNPCDRFPISPAWTEMETGQIMDMASEADEGRPGESGGWGKWIHRHVCRVDFGPVCSGMLLTHVST